MEPLARWVTQPRSAWAIVLVSLAVSAVAAVGATRVEQDDDLLAFLPEDNAEVARFTELGARFGGLDVALIGVEADDVLAPGTFAKLEAATRALDEHSMVSSVLGLANVQDFAPSSEGGIDVQRLVPRAPRTAAEADAAWAVVSTRDLVVGQLVAPDRRAALLYAFAAHGADPRAFADAVRESAGPALDGLVVHYGGAPFVSAYIYEATQRDLERLTPWAVLAIVVLVVVAFGDPLGAGLALLSTGMGIAIATGTMGWLGVRYNIVLSSMPVILFAVGSAYGIHVLACHYRFAAEEPLESALARALRSVGPTVVAAGLTTGAGLLSFLAMDIAPMRTFGAFTALGIGATLVLSLTFVPAAVRVLGITGRVGRPDPLGRWAEWAVRGVRRRRRTWGVAIAVAVAVAVGFTLQVDTRMDQTSFFHADSPPARADAFLAAHFGGASFLQVHVDGDLGRPEVLRSVFGIADRIAALPGVGGVQHVGQVIAQLSLAMTGERRVPDTEEQVRLLWRFAAGSPGLDQLATRDLGGALIHAKLRRADAVSQEAVLGEVEALLAAHAPGRWRVVSGGEAAPSASAVELAALRIRSVLAGHDHALPADRASALNAALAAPVRAASPGPVAARVREGLLSDEAIIELAPETAAALAEAVAALGPEASPDALRAAARGALGPSLADGEPVDETVVDDVARSIETPLAESWSRARDDARVDAVLGALGLALPTAAEPAARLRRDLRGASRLAGASSVLVPDAGGSLALRAELSGLPVLHRGLSESVRRNQALSLALALAAVFGILAWVFRSWTAGLLASAPTAVTLLAVYGGMGALGVHLDIGTSMLASLVIGAGVDYAVHLVAAWNGGDASEAAEVAARHTGAAIGTNALMVAAGFFVLTLGEARTLHNVGGLTAAAMLIAGVSTFVTIPVLARRRRYLRSPAPEASIGPEGERTPEVLP